VLKTHLLSALIGLSGLGSLLVSIIKTEGYPQRAHQLAFIIMIGCLVLGGLLYWNFDYTQTGLQFQESYLWIKQWNIRYAVGIDGLSLSLILLTLFIISLVVLTSWQAQYPKPGQYLSHFLLIQALIIGSFAAADAIFFYICWEAVLIPILLNIGIWGSQKRAYASIKFFLYTFVGSAGLLIALLYLGHQHNIPDFRIQNFYPLTLGWTAQRLLFIAFFIAFTIKVPLWPLHTWLPDAHTEAPREGSMVLAALMLKLGGYGLLRFCLPIVPDAGRAFAPIVCILSLIAIIYAGLIALAQTDMKRLIAYSSISHMGIVVLGIFLIFINTQPLTQTPHFGLLALEGAALQMIAHALSTTGLFLSIGLLYQRFHSRQIVDYQGLAMMMPLLAGFCLLFILSTIGLPGTAGFIGEFLIITSAVHAHFWIGGIAASTLLLSATYALWFYGRVFWGELRHPMLETIATLYPLEKVALYLLGGSVLLVGIWPAPLLKMIQPALKSLLQLSLQSKL
jgi:NADH-quinone oxidoreductase subunit M